MTSLEESVKHNHLTGKDVLQLVEFDLMFREPTAAMPSTAAMRQYGVGSQG